jgi:hypothetical protein
MDTEINQNTIIGHIAGLTDHTKEELYRIYKKSQLSEYVDIIDADIITSKIVEDNNMGTLFAKFEYYTERSKDHSLSQMENKSALAKAKQLEKKMFQYWKAKMEYYINKIVSNTNKRILLIGYLSFFKNHRIYLNLDIKTKFFLKVDFVEHAKAIIKYNLENSKNDIIDGNFDLNFLDINFLVKKRIQLQTIYTKINYIIMSLTNIIKTIELNIQTDVPDVLYFASFVKYDKKIPVMHNTIQTYQQEWLALSSILVSENANSNSNSNTNTENNNGIEKGVRDGKAYLKMTKEQIKKMSKNGYIYEITNTDNFLPFPSKHNVYKYFTVKPVKINRMLELPNIVEQIRNLNILIDIV